MEERKTSAFESIIKSLICVDFSFFPCHLQVFLKDQLEYSIERQRHAQLKVVAMTIKRRIVGYLQRKKYIKIRADIIRIQKNYKVCDHVEIVSGAFSVLVNRFCPVRVTIQSSQCITCITP